MNKVRIFDHYVSTYELEEDINSFASEYKIINVSFACERSGYSFLYFATVLYEE
ncbi:MAG: hypothetical protein J6C46_00235 [Clostridia bacterium]|nr:hypothetical protein [Clostridia bacterium]